MLILAFEVIMQPLLHTLFNQNFWFPYFNSLPLVLLSKSKPFWLYRPYICVDKHFNYWHNQINPKEKRGRFNTTLGRLACRFTRARHFHVTVARNETTRNKNVENQNLSISYQIFEINPSVIVIMKGIGPIKPLESFHFIHFWHKFHF